MSDETASPLATSPLAPDGLPIGQDVWVGLERDLLDLCKQWTDEICKAEAEMSPTGTVDAKTWMLRAITVTEASKLLAAQLQERLLLGAKGASASNAACGRARGLRSGEAVRQRMARKGSRTE